MTNTTIILLLCIFPLVIVLLENDKAKNISAIIELKRKREGILIMTEIFYEYIDKYILIQTLPSATIAGKLEKINDGWATIRLKDNTTQAVNIEYISSIKEIPLNKKGKPKSIYI